MSMRCATTHVIHTYACAHMRARRYTHIIHDSYRRLRNELCIQYLQCIQYYTMYTILYNTPPEKKTCGNIGLRSTNNQRAAGNFRWIAGQGARVREPVPAEIGATREINMCISISLSISLSLYIYIYICMFNIYSYYTICIHYT